MIYKDGKLVSKNKGNEKIIKKPINQVVYYGTHIEPLINQELFAREMLSLVNELIVSFGIHKLEYDPQLQQGTDIRTNEILEVFSHTRPDGGRFSTALGNIQWSTIGENIASSTSEGYDPNGKIIIEEYMTKIIFDSYYNSKGHYENMVNEEYSSFATAIIRGNYHL